MIYLAWAILILNIFAMLTGPLSVGQKYTVSPGMVMVRTVSFGCMALLAAAYIFGW